MAGFLSENWGNLLVLALLALVLAAVIRGQWRGRKEGKSGCGCGCDGCPSRGICHPVTFSREKK